MESPLLAAVLIVKDEEEDLPGCLASLETIRPVLGQVVVYDTGSVDSTVQIARDHGAVVVDGFWDADFARARNDATSHAHAKWVLSIDADERVVADPRELRTTLRQGLTANLVGWDIANVTILDVDAHGAPLARHPFCKLFRPSRVHWVSPIHETLAALQPGRAVVTADVPESIIYLRHHGYAQAERRRAKATRNAGVARTGLLIDDPSRTPDARAKLLADEARSLRVAGDPEGAARCYEAALALDGLGDDRVLLVVQDAVSNATSLGHFGEAASLIERAQALGGSDNVVKWLRANLLIECGRPAEALPILRGLHTVRLSSSLELDGSIAVATLMEAAIAAREFDEALACAIQLVGSTADVERYGAQLMRLWGDQPAVLLAELLTGIVGPRREQVAAGMDALPAPGPAVAAHLRRSVEGAPRNAGSAFGVCG